MVSVLHAPPGRASRERDLPGEEPGAEVGFTAVSCQSPVHSVNDARLFAEN